MKEKMQIEEAIEILERNIIADRRSGKIQNVKALALAINALRENAYITSSSSYKELQELRKLKKDNNRPTGKWKLSDNRWGLGSFRCSNCNIYYDTDPNFCPNCGAKMKGAEE